MTGVKETVLLEKSVVNVGNTYKLARANLQR